MMGSFVGCDSPNAQKQTYETLAFKVDETRLEPAITDTTLRIKIAAPKDWKKNDDSMLTQVVDNRKPSSLRSITVSPELFTKRNFEPLNHQSVLLTQ